MGNKMRHFGLIIFGVITGVMLSLNFSANADKETQGCCILFQSKSSAHSLKYSVASRVITSSR